MADTTAIQESAHALFCALGDYIGAQSVNQIMDKEKYPDYYSFEEMWNKRYKGSTLSVESIFRNRVATPGVTFTNVTELLSPRTGKPLWYYSALEVSKAVINQVNKINTNFNKIQQPKWTDLFYFRGDPDVMITISQLYNLAKKTHGNIQDRKVLSQAYDINKWSPADIYFASREAKKTLKTASKSNSLSFSTLNKMMATLIDSGDLLPLSLKQQPRQANLYKVNFNYKTEAKNRKTITYNSRQTNNWKPYQVPADVKKMIEAGKIPWTKSRQNSRTARSKNVNQNSDPNWYAYKLANWNYNSAIRKMQTRSFEARVDPRDPKVALIVRHSPEGMGPGSFKGEVAKSGDPARQGSLAESGFIKVLKEACQSGESQTAFATTFATALTNAKENYRKWNVANRDTLQKLKRGSAQDKHDYNYFKGEASAVLVSNVVFALLQKWLNENETRGRGKIISQPDILVQLLWSISTSRTNISSKFVIAK